MRLICLSHSTRPFEALRASPSSLAQRFSQHDRLTELPEWSSLQRSAAPNWSNNITVWRLSGDVLQPPELVSFIERDFTANHAVIDNGELLVCGATFLEVCDLSGERHRRASHNWFAGGHTVAICNGEIVVSCSASDALLWFDRKTLKLTRLWRVPSSVFGSNYEISTAHDIREHYIATDCQLAHLNSAYPLSGGRVLVTALIQGSLGIVDRNGSYREVVRGFVGAHGGRVRDSVPETFYFANTPHGALVEVTGDGEPLRTCVVGSEWLHDVLWLEGPYFLFAVSDRNALELWDVERRIAVWTKDVSDFGETALLLSSAWEHTK